MTGEIKSEVSVIISSKYSFLVPRKNSEETVISSLSHLVSCNLSQTQEIVEAIIILFLQKSGAYIIFIG